jgi:hypothetical protein
MRMTRLSRLRLVLLLATSFVLLAAGDCSIDIGNLGDYVVTYDITITNAGPEAALVFISGRDVKRKAVLQPGGSVTATSFRGGSVLLGASPAVDYVALLKQKRDAIQAKLDQKPLDLLTSMAIYRDLDVIYSNIRDYEQRGHGSLCAVDLKPDSKGKGSDVTATATLDFDTWKLAC